MEIFTSYLRFLHVVARLCFKVETMDRKLEAVLAQLCARLGPLFKTLAVKLPYLVDVIACQTLGRRVTSATHQTWEHGVVTREVYGFITHGTVDPLFCLETHDYSESGSRISLCGDLPICLDDEERRVVDLVADEFGGMTPERLGELTKRLNTEVPTEEWGSNKEARVDEEAYLRLDRRWQELGEQLTRLDLGDRRLWSGPINEDPLAHLKASFD